MSDASEKATQKLSDEILNALGKLEDYDTSDDRRKYFQEALSESLEKLTKAEIIAILSFVMGDYELFFDVFEQSLQRSRDGTSKS